MAIINVPIGCVTGAGNTAIPSCGVSIDHLKGLFLCFDGFEIPNASLTDFATALAYLQTKTLAANLLERLYPLSIIEGCTNNTAAPEKKNSGYGNTQYTAEQPHQFELELENVGIEYFKRLRRWNGRKDLKVYWIDTEFIGGHQTSTGFAPIEASLFVKQVMPGNIADYTKYMADLELKNPKSLTDLLDTIAIPEGYDLESEVNGVTGISLTSPAAWVVKAQAAISKEDLYDKYADALAVTGAWKATNALTGAIIAVSTVVKSAANKGWTITLATVTAADITLADPAALAALNVGSSTAGGYESEGGVRLGE